MQILDGWKTYLAAAVSLVAGGALLYVGQYETGAGFIVSGLGLVGLGHKAEKILTVLKPQQPPQEPPKPSA